MSTYRLTYESGREIDVELTGSHVPSQILIEEARKLEDVRERVVTITRDPGTPAELVTWHRTSVPADPEPEPGSFRLFVSFAYEIVGTVHTPNRPAFGNTVLDIDFEPSEPAHVESLQAQIAAHTNIDRVIILGWQRIAR